MNFACPLIEAAAMGLPAVASDLPGPREIVVHGITGFLAPAHRPAPLAWRLGQPLCDPALRHRMGRAGVTQASGLFAAAATGRDLAEIYASMMPGAELRV